MDPNAEPILFVGCLLGAGAILGNVAAFFGLPRVLGYMAGGIAFSEGLLGGLAGMGPGEWSRPLTEVCLGVIAYLIGGAMTFGQLRRLGSAIVLATILQLLGALALVALAAWFLAPAFPGVSAWSLALALGAIACATDPAATVAVMHQFRAKGPLSSALLAVTALDDALGLIAFAVIAALVGQGSVSAGIEGALASVGGSVLLGAGAGGALALLGRFFPGKSTAAPLALGFIVIVVGATEAAGWEPLLAAMSLGFAARSARPAGAEMLFKPVEELEQVVLIVFFGLSGSFFKASAFFANFGLLAAYLVARAAGKIAGAGLGAKLGGAPPQVTRWLGWGLVPQAGVALGLTLSLARQPAFASAAPAMLNLVLAATVANELAGPLLARFALDRAGELGDAPPRKKHQ